MKRSIGLIVAVLATLAFAGTGAAGPPTSHGPYAVTTTDGGCGGNQWANDTISRTFLVKKGPGTSTWRLTRVDRGTFSTIAGLSPGNCAANVGPHGTIVAAGETGKLHGRLVGIVTGGTYNPTATCGNECGTTSTFVTKFFGPAAHYSCLSGTAPCTFKYDYRATHGSALTYKHWTDKGTESSEQFSGDIAS